MFFPASVWEEVWNRSGRLASLHAFHQNSQLSSFLNRKVVRKVRMCPSKFHCNGFFSYHTDITERQAINKKCVRLLFQLLSSLAINLALDWSMQKHFVTPFPQICSLNFFFYAPATSHLLDCQPLNQGCHLLQVGCCKWSIGEFKTQLLLILIGIKCLHKMPQPKLFVVLSDTIHRQIIKFQAVILNHLPNRIRIYKVKK